MDAPLLKLRRTKIVATVGPATSCPDMIEKMMLTGVNVFRLNMSHGSHETHAMVYHTIRELAQKHGLHIGILADLCGPKIRVGEFREGSIELCENEPVTVTTRDVMGEAGLIPSRYRALAEDVKPGDRILLDDGLLELTVEEIQGTEIHCRVINGGTLNPRKGMNLPGVAVSAPALTTKDQEDARFAMELGVDLMALSFVRQAADIIELRELLESQACHCHLIAKIEKPEAVENIEDILMVSDGIMVARGDLGVELDPENVPLVQNSLLEMARAQSKPTIVATQMLESMMANPRATRAEVSDVSHAVQNGTDAVMLSGETAVGRYPLQAIGLMDRIARRTESELFFHGGFRRLSRKYNPYSSYPLADAVARSTSSLSRDLNVRAIVVVCRSGLSATVVSSARPSAPILAIGDENGDCQRIGPVWGVFPQSRRLKEGEDVNQVAREVVQQAGLGQPKDYILLVQGFNRHPGLNAPSVRVLELLPEPEENTDNPGHG